MAVVNEQIPIESVIDDNEFKFLDEVYQKHKFDLQLVYITNPDELEKTVKFKSLMIEVNYKHKEGAAKKWKIFRALLEKHNIIPVTIDDFDCRKKGLFYLDSKKHHELSWDDFRDVIDALDKAGVKP